MSFDAIAPWYRALETIAFGNALQRARVACLDAIGSPRRALIVGEGNGKFLAALLQRQPLIRIDCVDGSERMLELARGHVLQRVSDEISRVAFLQHDVTTWTPNDRYDLIVTHFLLDCFSVQQVGSIIAKLAQAAAPNATWLLADFRIPEAGFARAHARAGLAVMYRFFRSVARIEARELVDPSPFLRAEGFVLERQILFRFGMLKSELWLQQDS
ncbi:MAG TPA: class I SAM-dependent methyltransferase [Chthoniobacterales bacterium]|nr:class I SAM-dependent methyltransferase [Chthoniobacterales bacterium]